MYFRCPKCRKTFKKLRSKQCHIGRMHKKGICDACGGEFDDLCTHKLWHCLKNPKGKTPREALKIENHPEFPPKATDIEVTVSGMPFKFQAHNLHVDIQSDGYVTIGFYDLSAEKDE